MQDSSRVSLSRARREALGAPRARTHAPQAAPIVRPNRCKPYLGAANARVRKLICMSAPKPTAAPGLEGFISSLPEVEPAEPASKGELEIKQSAQVSRAHLMILVGVGEKPAGPLERAGHSVRAGRLICLAQKPSIHLGMQAEYSRPLSSARERHHQSILKSPLLLCCELAQLRRKVAWKSFSLAATRLSVQVAPKLACVLQSSVMDSRAGRPARQSV